MRANPFSPASPLAGSLTALSVSAQLPAGAGDPLPGITPREFEEFRLGLEDFKEVEEAGEGLGPLFNGAGCAVCHNVPVIGGSTPDDGDARGTPRCRRQVPRRRLHDAVPDVLDAGPSMPGGDARQRSTSSRGGSPIPLFGAGLVEAVPDETMLALEDPFDRDRDGISGRAAIVTDVATGQRRVGRFGWKAQIATLLTFSGDAYTNEMGITNDMFPLEPLRRNLASADCANAIWSRTPKTRSTRAPASARSTTSKRS